MGTGAGGGASSATSCAANTSPAYVTRWPSSSRRTIPTPSRRPRPLSATPRLSVQRQSIGLAEDGEEATEVAVGGRHRRQPRAAGARISQAAGGQDDDDRLLGVERATRGELYDGGQRCRGRGLDVEAFLARESALSLQHALVGQSHTGAARLAQRGESLPRPVA